MLTVEHYELIRRKVVIEGKSQRDVAKELHHSRKTIAKALELRIPPGYRLSKPHPRPVIEPVRHIIDAWLEQNKHTWPKQRQTGQRIYERPRFVRSSWTSPTSHPEAHWAVYGSPHNGPIFLKKFLQPDYNPTIRYLPNRKISHSISYSTPVIYKNHKNCERFQWMCPAVPDCK